MLRKSLMARSLVCAAAIVLAAGSLGEAQQPGRGRGGQGGFGGFGGIGKAALLQSQQVKTELNITEEQGTQISTILRESREGTAAGVRERFQGLRDLSPEERQARMADLREAAEKATAELDAKLSGVLTSEQSKRLDQILVQQQGSRALTDAKVQEKLGLSDEQKTKITDVLASQRDALGELSRDLDREERQAKTQEIRTETDKALNEVLTAAQQAQYAEMKGSPFELDRAQLFGGGRGGRGEGAAPGGRRGGRGEGAAPGGRRGQRGQRGSNAPDA